MLKFLLRKLRDLEYEQAEFAGKHPTPVRSLRLRIVKAQTERILLLIHKQRDPTADFTQRLECLRLRLIRYNKDMEGLCAE